MDKNAVFRYVEFAREELQKLTRQKAFEYGVTEKGAESGLKVVNGRVLSKNEYDQREALIDLIKAKAEGNAFSEGYELVIEEAAYTWFNRFIALRFMEVNGYLPSHTRVFSDENGQFSPQILKEALNVDLYGIDRLKVSEMVQEDKTEELFKYLIILQCNALSKPMPKMFEKISNYTELLFPNGLLKKGSIIERLVIDIPEDNWTEQVQIIGWMYQFYVSSKRQEFRNEKVVTKKLIPTLTQVFTPDWIVKYMAENSIGRIWLESYPDSSLKSEMKYYVDDAKQEADVVKKIEEIKYKNVNPEDLKIIEPCCGSGHILAYVFDLLFKMYEEKGYQSKEIPSLILKKNLVGLEIDRRAAQLAYFSLMMKARAVDRQYLIRDTVQQPKIIEISDSLNVANCDYEKLLKENKFSDKSISIAKYLVSTFKNAKTIGSLVKVSSLDYAYLCDEIDVKNKEVIPNILEQYAWRTVLPELRNLAIQAMVMSNKYDVMITNPPYLGISKMEKEPKEYLTDNYPNSKSDMFAMFMEAPYVKKNGFISMVNPDSWMFLVSFEQLRKKIIKEQSIVNMIHLGMGAFDATVQTTSFVIRNAPIGGNGVYFRLVDEKDKEAAFLAGGGIIMNLSSYNSISGEPFAYWINQKLLSSFRTSNQLNSYSTIRNGLKTGDNNEFVRFWFEVSNKKTFFCATDYIQAMYSGKTWFPYNKGGEFHKWYGNNEYVLNWKDKGRKVILDAKNDKRNVQDYPDSLKFTPIITWSLITSYKPSFRYKNYCISDICGMSLYEIDEKYFYYCLGFLNSSVSLNVLDLLNPTLNFQAGDIGRLPLIEDLDHKETISKIVKDNVKYASNDWDSFETSWDFKKHPLI